MVKDIHPCEKQRLHHGFKDLATWQATKCVRREIIRQMWCAVTEQLTKETPDDADKLVILSSLFHTCGWKYP